MVILIQFQEVYKKNKKLIPGPPGTIWAYYHLFLGSFPPPPAVAQLLQLLPPPWSFKGPFIDIEKLMESLAKFNRERKYFLIEIL